MDLSSYYAEICKIAILTKKEEQELFRILKNEDSTEIEKKKARDRLLSANLRFVFKQAKKFSKNDPSMFEELIAAGNEGLIVGLNKFDPSQNVRFLTYGASWIIQRILKEMSKMRIVSLPIWKQQLAARITKIKDNNPNITFEDIKKEFPEVAEKDLLELFQTRFLTYYISDLEEENFQINPIEAEVEKEIDSRLLAETISSLGSPYREIISMTFGLEDGKEQTSASIIKKLGLTKEEFKECKKEAMEILRDKFNVTIEE